VSDSSFPSCFDHPNNIPHRVQIMKLLIVQPPVTSSLFGPNIPLSALFSNTLVTFVFILLLVLYTLWMWALFTLFRTHIFHPSSEPKWLAWVHVRISFWPQQAPWIWRLRVVRHKNLAMGPAGLGTKNDCAGEGQLKFTRNRTPGGRGTLVPGPGPMRVYREKLPSCPPCWLQPWRWRQKVPAKRRQHYLRCKYPRTECTTTTNRGEGLE
jgi:hypothetical protein